MENNGFSLETAISVAKLFEKENVWKFNVKIYFKVYSAKKPTSKQYVRTRDVLHITDSALLSFCIKTISAFIAGRISRLWTEPLTTNLKCLGLLCRKLAGSLKRTRDGLWWSPQTRDITLLVMVWWENNNYIGVSTNGINYWLYLERLSWTSCLEQPGISALERFWFKRRSLHEPKQIHKLL